MTPSNKHNIKMAIMCLAAGIALGISLMFSLEFSDHSLRNGDDAAVYLQMPVLSTLSSIDEAREAAAERRKFVYATLIVTVFAGLILAGIISLKLFVPAMFTTLQETFF